MDFDYCNLCGCWLSRQVYTMNQVDQKYLELRNSFSIFSFYLKELKNRNNGKYPSPILNEIRAMHDHVARCYLDEAISDSEIQLYQLKKALGHLKRARLDCFKYLNSFFNNYLKDFEKNYFGSHWTFVQNGSFLKNYYNRNAQIREFIKIAKEKETNELSVAKDNNQNNTVQASCAQYEVNGKMYEPITALDFFLLAYMLQETLIQDVEKYKSDLIGTKKQRIHKWLDSWAIWSFFTILSSIIAAMFSLPHEIYEKWWTRLVGISTVSWLIFICLVLFLIIICGIFEQKIILVTNRISEFCGDFFSLTRNKLIRLYYRNHNKK